MIKQLHTYLSLLFLFPLLLSTAEGGNKRLESGFFMTELYGGYRINSYASDFSGIDGIISDCCAKFRGGTGQGHYFGLSAAYKFSSLITIGSRLSFNDQGAAQSAGANHYIPQAQSYPVRTDLEFTIISKLNTLDLEPYISFEFIDNLELSAGLSVSTFLKKDYTSTAKILSDNDITFQSSGTKNLEMGSGRIRDAADFLLTAVTGISYFIPLDLAETIYLAPEIKYSYGLTSFLPHDKWNISGFDFGLRLIFTSRSI